MGMGMLVLMRMWVLMMLVVLVHVLLGDGQELRILQQVRMLLEQGRMWMLQWLRSGQVADGTQLEELPLLGGRGEGHGLLLILDVLLQGTQAAQQAARIAAHLLEPLEGVAQILLLLALHRLAIGTDDELGYLGRRRSGCSCSGHHAVRSYHLRRGIRLR